MIVQIEIALPLPTIYTASVEHLGKVFGFGLIPTEEFLNSAKHHPQQTTPNPNTIISSWRNLSILF